MRGARLALAMSLTLLTVASMSAFGWMLAARCASATSYASLADDLLTPDTIVEVEDVRAGPKWKGWKGRCGVRLQDATVTVRAIHWQKPWRAKHDDLRPGDRIEVFGTADHWRDVGLGLWGPGPVLLGVARHPSFTDLHWGLIRAPGGWFLTDEPGHTETLHAFQRYRGGPEDAAELAVAWNEEEVRALREANGDWDLARPGPIEIDWLRFVNASSELPDPWYDRPPDERLVEDAPAHVKDRLLRFRLSLVIPEVSSLVPRWRDLEGVTFCLRSSAGIASCNTLEKDIGLPLVQMQGFAVPGETPLLTAGASPVGPGEVVVGRIPTSVIRDGGNVRADLGPVAPSSLFELVNELDRFGLSPERFRWWSQEEYRRLLTEKIYVGRG